MLTWLPVEDWRRDAADLQVPKDVAGTVERIRQNGDAAVREAARRFGEEVPDLRVPREALDRAGEALPEALRDDILTVYRRLLAYHRTQLPSPTPDFSGEGLAIAHRQAPVGRVGVYVPSGRFPLVSTLLMTVAPARAAGVREIAVASPPGAGGVVDPAILGAAALLDVDEVYAIGGVQAVAALALGTETVPRVDLVAGPGNRYVTAAKKYLAGEVGVDLLAGPSELVVLADGSADPAFLAADLAAQAEHDPDAVACLVTTDAALGKAVCEVLEKTVEPGSVAAQALRRRGRAVYCRTLDEAVTAVNRFAPEHLQVAVEDEEAALSRLTTSGAVFVGPLTGTVLGDYVAGPSHVLPTAGSGRFSSGLSVRSFLRTFAVVRQSGGADDLLSVAERLARTEGLVAHARSAALRLTS